ncbi:hypothetical protein GCM10019016_075500 [Streptomyces prasinosporus]|uniref:Uncharacterized protein n=1 Tax=Streptomyces prasinosporus TaxID=68256 RepID=A0ABP6TZ89_9ACTN
MPVILPQRARSRTEGAAVPPGPGAGRRDRSPRCRKVGSTSGDEGRAARADDAPGAAEPVATLLVKPVAGSS